MTKIRRTTITVSPEWDIAVAKAKEMGISMSEVVKVFIQAWIGGVLNVKVRELVVEQTGEIVIERGTGAKSDLA